MRKLAIGFLGLGIACLLLLQFVPRVILPQSPSDFDGGTIVIFRHELVQAGISGLLLVVSSFVILSTKCAADDKKWAYATIGTLLGFWLR
jgi:hypothetical protein